MSLQQLERSAQPVTHEHDEALYALHVDGIFDELTRNPVVAEVPAAAAIEEVVELPWKELATARIEVGTQRRLSPEQAQTDALVAALLMAGIEKAMQERSQQSIAAVGKTAIAEADLVYGEKQAA